MKWNLFQQAKLAGGQGLTFFKPTSRDFQVLPHQHAGGLFEGEGIGDVIVAGLGVIPLDLIQVPLLDQHIKHGPCAHLEAGQGGVQGALCRGHGGFQRRHLADAGGDTAISRLHLVDRVAPLGIEIVLGGGELFAGLPHLGVDQAALEQR